MEVKRGERTYQLMMASESPLGEIFDVLQEMTSEIIQQIEKVKPQKKENECPEGTCCEGEKCQS